MRAHPAPALASLALAAAAAAAPSSLADPRTPLAELDGEILYREDVEGAVAFRIYRHEVDIYSLLRAEAERRVDEKLLSREAERRGVSVEALLEEIEGELESVTGAEVERYLAEHPTGDATPPAEAKARVRHYLAETRRIERRLAFLAGLREAAGYRLLLAAPTPPRTEVDVAGAPARGATDAPVTVVHFASFSSRHSARSAAHLARLVEEFPGRIRWIHRNLLNDRDERGLLASRLGFLAQDEGHFWELHDRWFARAGKLDAEAVVAIARECGLDDADLERAFHDSELLRRVKRDLDAAKAAGAPREPTLFVNGRYVAGISPYEEIRSVLVEELERIPQGRGSNAHSAPSDKIRE